MTTQDEKTLRSQIDNWSTALHNKDTNALTVEYTEDSVLFDCKPPYKAVGRKAIQEIWDECMPFIPAGIRTERADEKLVVDGSMAYYHGLVRMHDDNQPNHPCFQQWMRVSVIYRKIENKWMAVHEHVSAPYNPMTNQVSPITDLDDLMCGVDYSTCEPPQAAA